MVGYRTVIIAAVVAIIGALQGLDWAALLPTNPQAAGWAVSGLGLLMGVLRLVTSTSVGSDK